MKEKNFRITCTCDNAFTLAEGREESIDEYLKTIDPSPVEAIKKLIIGHFNQEMCNSKYKIITSMWRSVSGAAERGENLAEWKISQKQDF